MKTLVLLLILSFKIALTQDSLYLVNSLVGEVNNRLINAKTTGDLNGDGYADLAVIFDDSTYICFGNPTFDLKPDYVIHRALSFPGDVNNDGFADYLFLKNNTEPKKIYLGFGGINLDTAGILIYTQQYTAQVFSGQVDPLGDVNGDGYNDFIISSPYNWGNGISYVYLFLGGDSISNEPFVTFIHSPWIDNNSETTFGTAVTGIGDMNKDGYDDFLVSDPGYADTVGSIGSGRVYLYYGSSEINSSVDSILTFPDKKFGFNLKKLGDINNDETIDFAITSFDSCVIYLNNDCILTTQFYGTGNGIGGNGDVNNDNVCDFILGYIKGEENDYSGMECYTGSPEIDLIPDYYANEEQDYSSFAKHSDFIGDFNNDGYDDIFVVATTFRHEENEIGKFYLYSYVNTSSIAEEEVNLFHGFVLYPNFPNPFNSTTLIPYYLSTVNDITIEIYDIQGKRIINLLSGITQAGLNTVSWNGKTDSGYNASSGVYFVSMKQSDNKIHAASQKIILLK